MHARPRRALRSELVAQLCRSPEAAARIVSGHWEGDLIKGAGGKSAIGTLIERTSRQVTLVRLRGISASHILKGLPRSLRQVPPSPRKTLTYDQGCKMTMQ